jgi:hypothetical protein
MSCAAIGLKMKSLIVLLTLLALNPCFAAVNVPDHWIDPSRPVIEDPDRLVDAFLKAVDRGELTIFGRTLEREMINPIQVEYVYDLLSRKTKLRIHATLKEALTLPDHPGCRILCISAEMEDGRIVEIESHLWIEP